MVARIECALRAVRDRAHDRFPAPWTAEATNNACFIVNVTTYISGMSRRKAHHSHLSTREELPAANKEDTNGLLSLGSDKKNRFT